MCFLQTRCAPIIAAHHDLPATTNKNNRKSRSQNKIKRKLLHLTKLQLPHSCMHKHLCWTSTQDIGLQCQEQNELTTKHVMFSITESPPTPRSERGRKTAPASATRGGPTWSPWNHCSCCAHHCGEMLHALQCSHHRFHDAITLSWLRDQKKWHDPLNMYWKRPQPSTLLMS